MNTSTTGFARFVGSILGLAALFCAVPAARAASVTLAWSAPTSNAAGIALTDLAGYRVYYGTVSGHYTAVKDVGAATTATLTNMAGGVNYYFVATAYDSNGNESAPSAELAWTPQFAPMGTPYAWLMKYGWTTNLDQVELEDSDGDGVPNWQEYIAGTDPTDASSYPRIESVSNNSPTNTVAFMTATGRVYTLLWTTNLANGGEWASVPGTTPVTGNGGLMHFQDPTGVPLRYYRLSVQLP